MTEEQDAIFPNITMHPPIEFKSSEIEVVPTQGGMRIKLTLSYDMRMFEDWVKANKHRFVVVKTDDNS